MRCGEPDLVIEIDSAHNEGSVEKLVFARDCGAVPVWVRWHSGRVDAPVGVEVIDLVAASRGLARARLTGPPDEPAGGAVLS